MGQQPCTIVNFGPGLCRPDLEAPAAVLLPAMRPSPHVKEAAQQTDPCVLSKAEEPHCSWGFDHRALEVPANPSVKRTAWQELSVKQISLPTWLRDGVQPPWSKVRHGCRLMLQPQSWNESFDDAYLGMVEESEDEDQFATALAEPSAKASGLTSWWHPRRYTVAIPSYSRNRTLDCSLAHRLP